MTPAITIVEKSDITSIVVNGIQLSVDGSGELISGKGDYADGEISKLLLQLIGYTVKDGYFVKVKSEK